MSRLIFDLFFFLSAFLYFLLSMFLMKPKWTSKWAKNGKVNILEQI